MNIKNASLVLLLPLLLVAALVLGAQHPVRSTSTGPGEAAAGACEVVLRGPASSPQLLYVLASEQDVQNLDGTRTITVSFELRPTPGSTAKVGDYRGTIYKDEKLDLKTSIMNFVITLKADNSLEQFKLAAELYIPSQTPPHKIEAPYSHHHGTFRLMPFEYRVLNVNRNQVRVSFDSYGFHSGFTIQGS